MKLFILTFILVSSVATLARSQTVNHCATYAGKERYLNAIEAVAVIYDMTFAEFCLAERFLAIEAQPSRKITREGDVIPHIDIHLHMDSSTCRYMIRDSDLTLTDGNCYSGE